MTAHNEGGASTGRRSSQGGGYVAGNKASEGPQQGGSVGCAREDEVAIRRLEAARGDARYWGGVAVQRHLANNLTAIKEKNKGEEPAREGGEGDQIIK